MAATGNNELLQVYAMTVLYVGTASADLTTSVVRRLAELTTIAEQTARLKAMTVSAGGA